jgi:hypothetical protein
MAELLKGSCLQDICGNAMEVAPAGVKGGLSSAPSSRQNLMNLGIIGAYMCVAYTVFFFLYFQRIYSKGLFLHCLTFSHCQ